MSRLISVAYTEQAVVTRRKTVTRRKGWWLDKNGRRILNPGDRLIPCRKVMGRKPGEALVRLAEVEVVSVDRESLRWLADAAISTSPTLLAEARAEVECEGFPGMEPLEFVQRFFVDAQGMDPSDDVTRIEWRYLDEETS